MANHRSNYGVTVILVAHTWTERNEPEEVIEIRIISAEKRPLQKGSDMKAKSVSYSLDNLSKPTPGRLAELERLEAMPDEQIDTSDVPELTEAQLAEMQRREFYRPIKKQITTRVDADVLAWLKKGGAGYQSRMNAILRKAMLKAVDR